MKLKIAKQMLILKRTQGNGVVFDTENVLYLSNSNIVPRTDQSLHLNHHMTDLAFLRQFFPESHAIFSNFNNSFYYVIPPQSTVKLKTLNEGDKFKFCYQDSGKRFYQVQHKLISQTGGIGVLEVSGWDRGVYHPDTDVIPV